MVIVLHRIAIMLPVQMDVHLITAAVQPAAWRIHVEIILAEAQKQLRRVQVTVELVPPRHAAMGSVVQGKHMNHAQVIVAPVQQLVTMMAYANQAKVRVLVQLTVLVVQVIRVQQDSTRI